MKIKKVLNKILNIFLNKNKDNLLKKKKKEVKQIISDDIVERNIHGYPKM